jgi:hypothetical protein
VASLPSSLSLARGLALNRIAFGAGLIVAPELYARSWVGSKAARRSSTKVFAQALGARDLVLGTGGLLALRAGDSERARQWFAAQGITDAVDLLATLRARDLPLGARVFASSVAAGSAAIAASYVRAPSS